MIPHQKNSLVNAWFSRLSRSKFQKNFHRISLTTRSEIPRFEPKVPAIVVANHPSWWDALLVCDLSRTLFRREFFGVFDEEQLRRYGIFRLLGGFAVEKKDGTLPASEIYLAASPPAMGPRGLRIAARRRRARSRRVTQVRC